MKASIIIPARNEAGCIAETIKGLRKALNGWPHRMIMVEDGSTDDTFNKVYHSYYQSMMITKNIGPHGFGYAVRHGLRHLDPDCTHVAIVMADGSDDPADVRACLDAAVLHGSCVFGTRFSPSRWPKDYPWVKLVLNRMGNRFVAWLFGIKHNDLTNAFKVYTREAIEAIQPLISSDFNLTLEMPLRTVLAGFPFKTVPISWTNRTQGRSKWRIKEIGSRYLPLIAMLWLQKRLGGHK